MAKTPIEDLRFKGTRFYENLATGNTPVDLYTGRDMSGRLINTGDAGKPLTIPIKNKRGNKGGSLTDKWIIKGKNVVGSPTSAANIVVLNDDTNVTLTTLTMDVSAIALPNIKTNQLALVTFEFDTRYVPSDPTHAPYNKALPFNSYQCMIGSKPGRKINGSFDSMKEFPIILEANSTSVVFSANTSDPIDAMIKNISKIGIYDVEYEDTSIIYYDHDSLEHVSVSVPAHNDFAFPPNKKVSNIITILGPHSANAPLLKKFNDNAEFFAQYVLNYGSWNPKDPSNPIPNATRYYPCAENGDEMYDMLSRAYKFKFNFHALKGIPESKIGFVVSKDTKVKVNGIEYVLALGKPSDPNQWGGVTVNNALNDGDIVVEFADAKAASQVTGFKLFNNRNAYSFIGGLPNMQALVNLDQIAIRKAAISGPFPKGMINPKIGSLKKLGADDMFSLNTLPEWGAEVDLSNLTNPEIKRVDLGPLNAGQVSLPPQLTGINIGGLNCMGPGGAVPKWQNWEHLIDNIPNLEHFNAWSNRGITGRFPDAAKTPKLKSYRIGYKQNGGVMGNWSFFDVPSFENNHDLESIEIQWLDFDAPGFKKWWAINKPGQKYVLPYNQFIPLFKNNTSLKKVILCYYYNPYFNSVSKQIEYIPDWSHVPLVSLNLGFPTAMEGKLIPSHFPVTLETFRADESTTSGGGHNAPVDVWGAAMVARLPKLKNFGIRGCNNIACDPSVFNGTNIEILDLAYADGWGTSNKFGSIPDFSTLPKLIRYRSEQSRQHGTTGTFTQPKMALVQLLMAGSNPTVADRSKNLDLSGGLPNLDLNHFTEFKLGQSTIGHEGTKNHIPLLLGSHGSLQTLALFDLPSLVGPIPELKNFKGVSYYYIVRIPGATGKIPEIGMTMANAGYKGHTVIVAGNKNITDYEGTSSSVDGIRSTRTVDFTDNSLTQSAVESILIAHSKGGALSKTILNLHNPVYDQSVIDHAKDPKNPIQGWKNAAPDLTKKAVKDAIDTLTTRGVQVSYAK